MIFKKKNFKVSFLKITKQMGTKFEDRGQI